MLQQITTNDGQVSGVDDMSAAASSVINWDVDDAGINRPRGHVVQYAGIGDVTTENARIIGLARWAGYTIAVTVDRKIWAFNDAVPTYEKDLSDSTSATQLEGVLRPVFAISDSYIYIAGGGRIQRWGLSLRFSEVIPDSPLCTHVASIGNRLVANDLTDRSIWRWSGLGEGNFTSWPAENATTADASPDPVLAVYANTNELFVFGTESTQVYTVGSDPTLPFDRASSVSIGLGAPYAAYNLDERFVMLDNRRRLVFTDGRTSEPFSDAIQKDIRAISDVSDCFLFRCETAQFSYVVARFPTALRTFANEMRTKRWVEWKTYDRVNNVDFSATCHVYLPSQGYNLFGFDDVNQSEGINTAHYVGRLIAEAATVLTADDDTPILCERTTGWHEYATTNRKRSSRVRLVLRRGTSSLTDVRSPKMEIRVQNDDGPWGNWSQFDLGPPAAYQQVVDTFATNALFIRRRYQFRYCGAADVSLVSAYDDVTDMGAA